MLQLIKILCLVSFMKLSSSLKDDICSCGDELFCSITPPPNSIYPCYLGTIESTTDCFLNDPLVNKDAIWQCGNCSDFGFDNYIRNDPIYKDMELWTLGSKKINKIEDKSLKLSQLNKDFEFTDITANDGIILKSIVFDPEPIDSNTKNPAIIFISSWGMNKWEYVIPANEYAKRGYTVISYTARGFWESGGEINMAGELDQADISTVIDWMLKNTNADINRIGMSGISYGGGLSLLGSAMDPRVKSIAAMSCWVDLANSFLSNGETIRKEAARFLELLAEITGKPSDDLETLFDDYFGNINLDFLYDYTYNSSSINYIDNINKNKPAVFIANALGDSLFTPNQFISFYNDITVTKHLEFAPGDHAGPELPGLLGVPDQGNIVIYLFY
jgi:cephalosporin-C deacetylase-like acetyl esterase